MYSEVDETEDKKSYNKVKTSNKIERIKIELFSYKSNVQQIKCFVDSITNTYLSTIENSRETKRFIYTLVNTKWEDNKYEMWEENVFLSTRTFNNIFFKKSLDILSMTFFLNKY
jgi:hypothetical protein